MTHELKVAVVGPRGHAGLELTRRLFRHPWLKSPLLLSYTAERVSSISPQLPELNLNGEGTVYPFSWSEVHRAGVDLLFLLEPEIISRELAAEAARHGLLCINLGVGSGLRWREAVETAIQSMNSAYGWGKHEETNGLEGAAGGI